MTRTGSLQNKVAVITGGAKGIGKAVATTLVERGARVIIGDVADKEGEELASTLNHK
jgi:NAD(P)-dependent dehydrogenase (short-subunit alcohol dehydrogenase family)